MASPRLSLSYLVSGQAQKEITHNDALNDLDSLAQISVINMTTNTPPGSPAEGDSYLIGSSPTGLWSGNAGKIASYYSGWRIKTPKEGWVAWVQDIDRAYEFDGTNWVLPSRSIAAGGYLNFGSTAGSSGYGLRDNAGTMEYKNSGGAWAGIGSGGGGGSGTVNAGTAGQMTYYAATGTAVSGNANATISSGALTLGVSGTTIGSLLLAGNTSGTISLKPQAAAGTYNFNLPITAGSSGQVLASGGGSAAAMTWTTLATVATSGSASDLSAGTLPTGRLPALTGDVSSSAGSNSVTVAKINGATLGTTTATSGNLLIGSGTTWATQAVSGDVTINSSGVTAIGASKVTNSMLAGSIDLATKVTGTLASARMSNITAIRPSSAYISDTAGRLFPNFYAGGGGNAAPRDAGFGVMASLSADATLELRFPIPPNIPAGTLKLRLLGLANASTGNAKLTVKDATVAAGASPSAASLTSETQTTVSWGAGDADKYKEAKITLTASPAANDMLVVGITFNTTSWTLAAASTWIPTLIWE
jgi:hypothetical protein